MRSKFYYENNFYVCFEEDAYNQPSVEKDVKNSRLSLITENLNEYPFYEQRSKVDRIPGTTSAAITDYNQVEGLQNHY